MTQTKQLTRNSHALDYYLNLKYPVIIYDDEAGGYTAEIKDLPGCLTQAETIEEVWENIEDARILWIETAYEYRDPIPLPSTDNQFSGKFLMRMPCSLHRKLAEAAEQEGVSLNQYVVYLLSEENTSRQHYSVISKLLSEKPKTMKIQGIKQGNAITLSEEPANLPDGTDVTIEITEERLAETDKFSYTEERRSDG